MTYGSTTLDRHSARGIMFLHVPNPMLTTNVSRHSRISAAFMAGALLLIASARVGAAPAPSSPSSVSDPVSHTTVASRPLAVHPWIEGVDPLAENRLFYATYSALKTHNVLKVYVFSAGGYESAGIRFSARVPHEQRDLTLDELSD